MYKMIIVDDETRIRRGLKNCINWDELGISVVGEASTGKEAIELVMDVQPHLIITDIKMPDIDGLAFIETIRNMGIQSGIIIISGYNDFNFAQKAIRYSVYDYILKPIDESELYDRISSCIKKIEENNEHKQEVCVDTNYSKIKNKNMFVGKALDFINLHYNEDISLNEVANHVYLHPNYFSTLFKENMGVNYSKYVAKLRITKAKELLKNPELKVYEVSTIIGYSDFRRFTKLFKFYEGVTPTEYRKSIY